MEFYRYRATVTKIIDGDTIRFDLDQGLDIIHKKFTTRLYGINTPEISGPKAKEEYEEGMLAKQAVESVIPIGTEVVVETYKDKTGKYGRFLADVLFKSDDELQCAYINVAGFGKAYSLCNYLLTQGLAEEY